MVHQAIASYEGEDGEWTPLCFTAETAGATIGIYKNSTPTSITFEISYDMTTWENYTVETDITLANIDDKVYFRNASVTTTNFSSIIAYYYFKTTNEKYLKVSGDITSLLRKTGRVLDLTTLSANCFSYLFKNTEIRDASNLLLTSTTLYSYCYFAMFAGCTNLTSPPILSATTLGQNCYMSMFADCTSLVTTPTLPITILNNYCYDGMFKNCTSLITAPALPATTLSEGCYSYMFLGCTSLTTPPVLTSTTLVNSCYSHMFENCTSLASIPRLSATTLANYCYYYMFSGCYQLEWSTDPTSSSTNTYYYFPTTSATKWGTNMLMNTSSTAFTPSTGTQYYCNVPFNS